MNHIVSQRFIECMTLLQEKGIVRSMRQFALSLDTYAQSLNEIIKGRRDVTIQMIQNGVEIYHINPTYLYTGKGRPFLKISEEDVDLKVLTVFVDEKGGENILHVPAKAAAGYTSNAFAVNASDRMLHYTIPGMDHRFGTYRSFELEGMSMYPTFEEGQVVICRFLEPSLWLKQLRDNHVYVVVTNTDVVIKRLGRLEGNDKQVICYSDNNDFEPYKIDMKDIREIWYVEKSISQFDQLSSASPRLN